MRPVTRALLGTLVLPGALAAQALDRADSLLAHGDTSGAITWLERADGGAAGRAEAGYRAALLYLARDRGGQWTLRDDDKARRLLTAAVRQVPDDARYWEALAPLIRLELVSALADPLRVLVGRAATDPEARHALTSVRTTIVHGARRVWLLHRPPADARPQAGWRGGEARKLLAEGARDLSTMVEVDPTNLEAAGLLCVMLGATDQWPQAVAAARRAVAAAPTSGPARAVLGMALARALSWDEAAATFDSALALMSPLERAPYLDLKPLLRHSDGVAFDSLTPPARAHFSEWYWSVAQPLALTTRNEVRTEYHARVTYVAHAWGGELATPDRAGERALYLRYGPPEFYGPVLEYARRNDWLPWRPGGSEVAVAVTAPAVPPPPVATFSNIPIVASLDTILVQTARFRGPGDSSALLVVGAIPAERLAEPAGADALTLVTGATVIAADARKIAEDRREETLGSGREARAVEYRTWRLTLPPDDYLLRVEALFPSLDRGARSAERVTVTPVPRAGLVLSDLVLAERVAPRDSNAMRWDDFLIRPSAGRFRRGTPVGLLWEVYNATPDSTGATRYEIEVRITVETIERKSTFMEIVGGLMDALGLTAEGDDQASLRYRRGAGPTPDAARAEYLVLDLEHSPAGRYQVTVVVHDLISGEEAWVTRAFAFGDEPTRR